MVTAYETEIYLENTRRDFGHAMSTVLKSEAGCIHTQASTPDNLRGRRDTVQENKWMENIRKRKGKKEREKRRGKERKTRKIKGAQGGRPDVPKGKIHRVKQTKARQNEKLSKTGRQQQSR